MFEVLRDNWYCKMTLRVLFLLGLACWWSVLVSMGVSSLICLGMAWYLQAGWPLPSGEHAPALHQLGSVLAAMWFALYLMTGRLPMRALDKIGTVLYRHSVAALKRG